MSGLISLLVLLPAVSAQWVCMYLYYTILCIYRGVITYVMYAVSPSLQMTGSRYRKTSNREYIEYRFFTICRQTSQ